MSSSTTYRFYVNDKRVSTAVLTKKGEFWQVYPTKRQFFSEKDWRAAWVPTYDVKTVAEVKPSPPPSSNKKDWTYKNMFSYTASAGTYYIGDLCYALDPKVYEKVFGGLGKYKYGLYELKTDPNIFFLVDGTAYGDGEYRGSDGRNYLVDAGILGILPISCATAGTDGGQVHTFKNPVVCTFGHGRFFIESEDNRVVIDTTGDDDNY